MAELIPQNSIINLGIIVGFPAISCSQTQQRMVNTEGKPQTSHLSGMNRYLFAGCLTSRGLVPKHGWYNAQLVSQRRWNPNGLSHTFLYPHEPYISHHKPTAFVFFLLIILYLVGGLIFFIFSHVLGIIIPTDELIFFRGVGTPPTRLLLTIINHIMTMYKPLLTVY